MHLFKNWQHRAMKNLLILQIALINIKYIIHLQQLCVMGIKYMLLPIIFIHREYCIPYTFLDDTLLLEKKSLLPKKVQGLCVDDNGYCYVSQSYGRNQSSYLSVYDNLEALQKNFLNERLCGNATGSEAVITENGLCYVLFETSSYKYYEGVMEKEHVRIRWIRFY